MTKMKKYLVRILVLVLVISMVLPMVACRKDPENAADPSAESKTYTVEVKSSGGMALPAVGVYVYEDETMAELVWFDQTGEDGCMTFTDVARDTYVAVLSDVPTGYAVEELYPITGERTEIVLQAGQLDEENIDELTYKLGDMMMDFTVTGPDGTEYTLSELLQQKKAVVLNFWYVECGPCKAEFPYLQEAYEKYSDDIALLALNPINTPEDIAAFQQENGYTFPMISCGPEWEKLMGITAYPTTVVIDRFGNICLIHKGAVDNAKTFEDTFAYFAAEDYEQKLIEDIKELETEAEAGTADNPNEVGGQSSFEIVVEPGQEVYTEIYKATGMYMSIRGEGRDFYVLYNDKKYTPDSSNTVGFVVTTGDNYTPALFAVGNTGTKTQTFKVSLSFLAGTFNNPYTLKLGEFTAKVSAGNDQGVNYAYVAQESGTLTVQCLSATAGVEYGYTLYNTGTMAVRSLEGDGTRDDGGTPTLSIGVNKGDRILFTVSTLPDDSNNYPAGTFTFLASFEAGEGVTVEKIEKIDYTVTVTDEADQPLKDIAVWLTKDGETVSVKTDDKGVATLNLEKGTYTGTVSVPEGYTLENNAFELTEEAPAATVKLTAAVDTRVEYTVKAEDTQGNPVEGVEILILGVGSSLTDANGIAVFKLEPGNYSVLTGTLPEDLSCSDMLTLTAETLSGTFTLEYLPGTANNPIMLTEADTTVTNAGTVYYGTRFDGTVVEITGEAGFQVLLDGQTITDTNGKVSGQIHAADPYNPATFAIVGDGQYRVTFTYPEGHQMNPAQLVLGENKATQTAGAADYYYQWTAVGDGKLTITMDAQAQWLYCISNLTTGVTGETHWSDDETPAVSETITVSEGDQIQVVVNTYDPADMFSNPAGEVVFDAAFAWVVEEVPFTTAQIPAGGQYAYEISGVNGATMTISDADAYVIYGSTTYGANTSGKVTLTIGSDDPVMLVIGNSGTESESYTVTFTFAKGSRQNPAKLTCKDQTFVVSMKASHVDGYYYTMTANMMGTVTFTTPNPPSGVDYTLVLTRNDGEEIVTAVEGERTRKVSVYVFPDDVLLLQVKTFPNANNVYPTASIVTKCNIEEDATVHTITFDANGGTLTGAATAKTKEGRLTALPADPVRETFVFNGWYDAPTGGNRITTDTTYRADTTVYAQWTKVEYLVTFNAGSGTLEGDTTVSTTNYKLQSLPTPTLEGHTFNGWFDAPAGGNQITVDMVYAADTVLYAQWTKDYVPPEPTIPYEVTVVDGHGQPVTSGVYVTWQSSSKVETKVINNASGTASAALTPDTYTVMLTFTGTYKDYQYDTSAAVATAEKPTLTIQIAAPISSSAEQNDYTVDDAAMTTLDVLPGTTYVKLNSSQPNYAVVNGTAYCFFRFLITEEGKYSITTTNGAAVSNWGTNTYFIHNNTTEEEKEANEFTVNIKESNFPEEEKVLPLIFAVEVSQSSTILLVKDAGDAEYTYMDAPFTVFEGTETPEVAYENGKPVAIEENIFQLTTGGKSLSYVNMLTDKAVKGEDGYYHLNSETGPILYINLGETAPYVSMGVLTGAIGQYGTGLKKIFYNEDGTPAVNPDGTYKKEDYTDAMVAYALHVDKTYGVCPLTDDLIYMIQHGGQYKGWYTPGSGTYLFEESDIEVDNSLAWMFAVCYLK